MAMSSFYLVQCTTSALLIVCLVRVKCLQIKNGETTTFSQVTSKSYDKLLQHMTTYNSQNHQTFHPQVSVSSLEDSNANPTESLVKQVHHFRHYGRQDRQLLNYTNTDREYLSTGLALVPKRQIQLLENRGKIRESRISRWKLFSMRLEKLDKMSKLLIQLSRKMSSRSLKNFRLLKANLKKVLFFVNQSRNKTVAVEEAHWVKAQPPYNHPASKGPGMKRSAQGSSFLCPKEFVGGGSWSSCYRLAPLQGNWYEARSYCNSLGAELLSMETLKEAHIIDYLIRSYGGINSGSHHHRSNQQQTHLLHHLPPSAINDFGYWTSATIAGKDQKWMWTSRTELRPMTYSRWKPGKPDSSFSGRCMIITGESGSPWSNAHCYNGHRFICEVNMN